MPRSYRAWRPALGVAVAITLTRALAACFGAEHDASEQQLAKLDDAGVTSPTRAVEAAASLPKPSMHLQAKCSIVLPLSYAVTRVDANGSMIAAGTVLLGVDNGVARFGLTVAKYDSECKLAWSHDYGSGSIIDADVDEEGNSIVVASAYQYWNETLDFGQGPLHGFAIVAKIAPGGATVWSRSLYTEPSSGNGYLRAHAIAARSDGTIVVGGEIRGDASFGSKAVSGSPTDEWFFVGQLNAAGEADWVSTFPGLNGDFKDVGRINRLAASGGNLFVTGELNGRLDFGPTTLMSERAGSAFVAKLNAGGAPLWAQSIPRGVGNDVTGDPHGHVYVGVTAREPEVQSNGMPPSDGFVLDLSSPTGFTLWNRGVQAIVARVAELDADRLVVAAEARNGSDSLGLGNGPIDASMALGIYDRAGALLWNAGWGHAEKLDVRVTSLAVDARKGNEDVVVSGYFRDSVDFGVGPLVNPRPTTPLNPSFAGFLTRFTFVDGAPQTSANVDGGGDGSVDGAIDAGPLRTWSSVALSPWDGTMCGLSAQRAYCAGSNAYGAFGNGSFGGTHVIPEEAAGAFTFVALAVGSGACGIDIGGDLYCWGPDQVGQVGSSNATCPNGPVTGADIPCQTTPFQRLAGTKFRAVSAGATETCAIAVDDSLYCWGSDALGALGYGVGGSGPKVVGGPYDAVSVGESFVCALDKAGAAWCWGGVNSKGELGANADGGPDVPDGAIAKGYESPVPITGNHAFKSISAGTRSACAIDVSGVPYCWGENVKGKLGDGTSIDRSEPTRVSTPPGLSFIALRMTAGDGFACGVTTTGAVYCWGSNASGQLGIGVPDQDPHPLPTLVLGLPPATTIAMNDGSVCALTVLGERWCWGYNSSHGQLGKGDYANAFSPVRVP